MRANPNDLAAAVSLGQCTVRDEEMVAPDGDSARLAFRTPWSPALRALRHAVQVNPSYTAAYRPLFRMLFAETRDGCSRATGFCKHVAPVLRDGDSLITIPRPVPEGPMEVSPYDGVVRETLDRQRPSLEEARALAERWAAVAPNDPRPHEYRGRAFLRLGDVGAAADVLEHAATLGTPESRRRLFWERLEALVKSNNGAAARRLLDEAVADPGRDTSVVPSYALATFNALVGRHRPPPRPPVDSARMREMRARRDSILRTRPAPPPPEPSFRDRIAVGDTAGARRMLVKLDSMLAGTFGRGFPRFWPDHLTSAEHHLALADTAEAEKRLAVIEQAFHEHPFQFRVAWAFGMPGPWVGRAWLLEGDLAAARGRRDDAAGIYRRVAGLWDGGDPEYQAVASDARVKLEALSRR